MSLSGFVEALVNNLGKGGSLLHGECIVIRENHVLPRLEALCAPHCLLPL